jgi:hypothetical protein
MKNLLGYLLIFFFAVGVSTFIAAPEKKEARVTQVIRDVRLLASKGAPRPASVNDSVVEGTAVRTGGESRAELTFSDQTLTRLGANTVFSFSNGGKQIDLSSGAILLAAPKEAGTTRINTAVATAAVTGYTMLYEAHKNGVSKWIMLEGHGTFSIKGVNTGPCELNSGQMIVIPAHPVRCPEVLTIDICKVSASAGLITQFPVKLPKWSADEIQMVCDRQTSNPPTGGFVDPTNIDERDQARPGVTPPPILSRSPPFSPPPSF